MFYLSSFKLIFDRQDELTSILAVWLPGSLHKIKELSGETTQPSGGVLSYL